MLLALALAVFIWSWKAGFAVIIISIFFSNILGSGNHLHIPCSSIISHTRPQLVFIRFHASTSRAWPGPLGRYGSAYQYNVWLLTRRMRRHLYQPSRPSRRERRSEAWKSTPWVTQRGSTRSVRVACALMVVRVPTVCNAL